MARPKVSEIQTISLRMARLLFSCCCSQAALAGLSVAHGAGGVRLPEAISRSAVLTVKTIAPLALVCSAKTSISPGPDRAEKLGVADLPVNRRATEQLFGKQNGAIEQHDARDNRPAGEMAGKGGMIGRHRPTVFSGRHA
jgi:hypothetical protein